MKTNSEWYGNDASIEISLFEQGLLFRKTDKGLHVCYLWSKYNGERRFSFSWFDSRDFLCENSWIDFKALFESCDSTIEFYRENTEQFCSDLFWYYGAENIFGTDCFGGYDEEQIRIELNIN